VLLPKDHVRFRLTGARITDVTDASGTNLLDVRARRWSIPTLDALGIDGALLPDLVEAAEEAGRVSADAVRLTGLPEGLVVVGGPADQAAAAIGNGVVEPGILSITLGTSGVVYAQLPDVALDPSGAFHTFCHAVPGTWQMMAGVLSAAGSLQWWRDTVGPLMRMRPSAAALPALAPSLRPPQARHRAPVG
jgi:xylulokinase